MRLEIGKEYLNGYGESVTIGGPTRDNPEWVWSIQGNWYVKETGEFLWYVPSTGGHEVRPTALRNIATLKRDWTHLTLNDVDRLYREGLMSEAETLAYIEEWNKGPHFTYAVLRDGAVRNYLRKED